MSRLLSAARRVTPASLTPLSATQHVRHLNLHEYQSKELMQKYNISIQKFKAVDNAKDAEKAAQDLGAPRALRLRCNHLTAI